jgi:hypothetical protein
MELRLVGQKKAVAIAVLKCIRSAALVKIERVAAFDLRGGIA